MTEQATQEAQPPQSTTPPSASGPSAGEKLKTARLEKGLELSAIANRLRLKQDQLEALENDNYEPFPAIAYALGFMRSYASFLGVDVSAEIQTIKAANQPKLHPTSLDFPEAPVSRGSFNIMPFVIVLMLAGAGYGAWSWFNQPEQPQVTSAPAPVEPPAAEPEEPAFDPVSEAVPPLSPAAPDADAQALDAPAGPLMEEPVRSGGDAALAAPLPAEDDALAAVDEAAADDTPEAAPTPAVPGEAPAAIAITFVAVEDTWLQIQSPACRILTTGVLFKGQSYTLPDRQGLTMITGNAGGLSVQIGTTMLGVLGKSGEIKQDVALNAETLRDLVSATQ